MKILTKADAIAFRKQIEAAALNLDDKAASESPDFYEHMRYDGKAISAGTRINFEGVLYKAAVTLWDTEENNPDNAPDLWAKIEYVNGIRIIPNVAGGSFDVARAFALNEPGYWEVDGKTYKSLLPSNVYTPIAYPQGWEEI